MFTRRQILKTAIWAGLGVTLIGKGGVITAWADAGPGERVYTVKRGDTLSRIASRNNVSLSALRTRNGLKSDRILVGQRLVIPAPGATEPQYKYINEVVRVTSQLNISKDRWTYIVGHHSGVDRGNAASYGRYHREERKMENGLAYHFVIGNGIDSGDGEVEIGPRWYKQLQGGHVRNHEVNQNGIGICLVGNFEKHPPTANQMEAFKELVSYLKANVVAPNCKFAVHREIDRNHTVCPGRHFPTAAMHRLYS